MRIAIGADHAGFTLKERLTRALRDLGHQVEDHGTHDDQPVDYPPICAAVAREVAGLRADRGIVLGGSGQGEQIAANKIAGIRAALCHDLYSARLSRAHNDANVLAMGGRIVAPELAIEIVKVWLETPFEAGRHQRRVDQIHALEHERTHLHVSSDRSARQSERATRTERGIGAPASERVGGSGRAKPPGRA